MLCDELGKLLITISNATETVFGDNAHVTHVVPSNRYELEGVILDITVTVLKHKYEPDTLNHLLDVFDALVYEPSLNSDFILSKVDVKVILRG